MKATFLSISAISLMIVAGIGLGAVTLALRIIRWIVAFVGSLLGIGVFGMPGICGILALLANGKVPAKFWPGVWKMESIFVPQLLIVFLLLMIVLGLELWLSQQGHQIQKLKVLFKSS